MKLKILTLLAAGLVFFSSCSKEEVDPQLEIYVTTKASDKYENAQINVGNLRFAIIFEDGDQGWGSIQNNYMGANYLADLEEDQSELIYQGEHFDIDKLDGMKLNLYNMILSDTNQEEIHLPSCTKYDYVRLDQITSIENGKSYKIDFIVDLDELVTEENGKYTYNPDYEIEITEL